MTPSNATIELYRGRDGLWRARVEWTDPRTGGRCVVRGGWRRIWDLVTGWGGPYGEAA